MFYESVGGSLYPKQRQSNWIILKNIGMKSHLDALFWEFSDAAFPWFVAENCHPAGDSYLATSTTARLGCVLSDATGRGEKSRTGGMRGRRCYLCSHTVMIIWLLYICRYRYWYTCIWYVKHCTDICRLGKSWKQHVLCLFTGYVWYIFIYIYIHTFKYRDYMYCVCSLHALFYIDSMYLL